MTRPQTTPYSRCGSSWLSTQCRQSLLQSTMIRTGVSHSLARARGILVDLSGTLHVENTVLPGAVEALDRYAVKHVKLLVILVFFLLLLLLLLLLHTLLCHMYLQVAWQWRQVTVHH